MPLVPPMAIIWSRQAENQLFRLSPRDQERVEKGIDRFALTGEGDFESLAGVAGAYRLRVGDRRVLMAEEGDALLVVAIKSRGQAYR